ncbi:BatA domain-containing protein [Singulisphaera sp. GP187]|uniref:BatA domain-containing protein n=1 Tax=Singulisphaera sp. GP187 TaxID=1882752 RepID=UPI000A4B4B91|nr:BatA domain-containing protein [Singulisphaera sp. GP187]
MNFLHPLILVALPLVALPVIIHLINQRRYQTVQWGAMMFLLAANRMSRGYARLRQWLIMAFRMAAIAALLFALSRPLAGGWLGFTAGGRPDTTIILLDRSPSMQQAGTGTGGSKLETGKRQLARALGTLGSNRWVLIESGTNQPRSLESADALLTLPDTGPLSAAADIPGMLAAARDYVRTNKPGRTEIWICSDLRRDDWEVDDGRWRSLRESFLGFPQGVRFHLLAYPRTAPLNVSIRVTGVRRQAAGDGGDADVLVSLSLAREGSEKGQTTVPIQFEIGGARSELTVEMNGPRFTLKDHRIPLERGRRRGWGKVSIPADANPADNDFYFAFDQPAPRRAIVVAEDGQAAQALRLAASIAPDPALKCSAEVVPIDQLTSVEWETVSLLLWQSPLPEGETADLVRSFVERGGRVFFFPPRVPGGAEFLGGRWTAWGNHPQEVTVETWRGDQDLLANTLNGAALPVGQLQVRKWCGLSGDLTPLASLKGGDLLLARATTNAGGPISARPRRRPATRRWRPTVWLST